MATIENKFTGEKLILHSQHTFGRSPNNISVIQENDVSRRHATIYWENNSWFLMDYSSNGTKINKRHIHHATKKLKKNDVIRFSNYNRGVWELINNNSPCCFLKAVKVPQNFIELDKRIVIIRRETQQVAIFRNSNNRWIFDDGKTETTLVNGYSYSINNENYIFIDNECQNETHRNIDLTQKASFQFTLSADEESVFVKIRINELILDLGSRSYNHLLLHLARIRKKDLDSGISEQSSGWVYIEELTNPLSKELMLEVDEYYINNLIFRVRKCLFDLHPYGHLFANIIERERGKLRFGFTRFIIEKEQPSNHGIQ
jgi:pSer/pThr/pTyr-binding forkhead associated (FHA) protein